MENELIELILKQLGQKLITNKLTRRDLIGLDKYEEKMSEDQLKFYKVMVHTVELEDKESFVVKFSYINKLGLSGYALLVYSYITTEIEKNGDINELSVNTVVLGGLLGITTQNATRVLESLYDKKLVAYKRDKENKFLYKVALI